MSEREIRMEELMQRIDELLNILNIISRDLVEVSKALTAISGSEVVPSERVQAIEGIPLPFPTDLAEMLDFEETETFIIIKPRGYLGSENFAKIAAIVRDAGGEYISSGKESHFRVSKDVTS